MRVRDKQINEMIGTTMKLSEVAASLDLPMVSCLYRMVLMELTNQSAEQAAASVAAERADVSAQ